METESRLRIAEASLNRVLQFFPRVDAKASFISALDTGMLATLALNFQYEDLRVWYVVLLGVAAAAALCGSLYFVYRCTFPQLRGGTGSRIYFGEIANRTESRFIDEFLKETEDEHLKDLLGQTWRNSEILRQKFDAVKNAFILTAIAMAPWLAFLVAVTLLHSAIKV